MRPRKASLRVAHSSKCPHKGKTSLESLKKGCTCEPSYFTFHRDRDGKAVKGKRIKDRRTAEAALRLVQSPLDEGRVGITREQNITFNEWADKFETIVDGRVKAGELHSRTLTSYKTTLQRARDAFGELHLREVGTSELRDFFDSLDAKLKPASRIRYLKELSVCFAAAVDEGEGWLDSNPVPAFTKKRKLRVPARGKAPFEDNELERLWTELAKVEPVYLHAARFSVETGVRLGELIALDWSNVDLLGGKVLIEFQHSDGVLVDPKDREARPIYLTPHAKAALDKWVEVVGVYTSGPVFPHPVTGDRLERRVMQRRFADAMTAAGIPKLHPELKLPRTLHSLRYSTSVLMQRRGYHPRLIEATLGHGSLELTYGVYGGWTPSQLAAEAARDTEAA